jgi:twitching motility protein PilT
LKERRQFLRIAVEDKVHYTIDSDPEKKTREARISNITEKGMLLASLEAAPPVSAKLSLSISSPGVAASIDVKGCVVRVYDEGGAHNFAIVFVNLEGSDKSTIEHWVHTAQIDKVLSMAVEMDASDIHFIAGEPPVVRLYGELVCLKANPVTNDELKNMLKGLLNEKQLQQYELNLELDVSYVNDVGRFRINVHQEKGQLGLTCRYIPSLIRGLEDLGLPEVARDLCLKRSGLVIITGPQGSGKSTTVAAMVDTINKEKKCIILTIEDPVEYFIKNNKSYILQREVGIDTSSFSSALKEIVRQDADVIVIGEIRDLESISVAMSAAETGHLVLTTLHTTDAISSINKIIEFFPHERQNLERGRLAEVFKGVIAQTLLPKKDKTGRVVATETLIWTNAVANIIRRGNLKDLSTSIETGAQHGMHTMKNTLKDLFDNGKISYETFLTYSAALEKHI